MQVRLDLSSPLAKLSLERPEPSRLPVLLGDAQHGIDAKRTQQFSSRSRRQTWNPWSVRSSSAELPDASGPRRTASVSASS
jgi:hypothetical protein